MGHVTDRTKQAEPDCRDRNARVRTARKGLPGKELPGQDKKNRTGITGQAEQESRTGQAKQDRQNRTGRQDRQNWTGRTGLADQDCLNMVHLIQDPCFFPPAEWLWALEPGVQ